MATSKVQIGLRLSEHDYERVKWVAQNEGRTMTNLICHLLHRYLDDYEAKNGPVPDQDE